LIPQGPSTSWLSPSGDFAFGFRPIEGNTSFYLLAIWFNKISDKTVAWYAKTTGPDPAPVQVSSGSRLQFYFNGALSLQDSTNTEVWSQVVGASYAAMLDSGNFVLVASDGSNKWESFKNPTDTILPTQVLTSGMSLRSRIIPTDYSNGRFFLDLESTGVSLYTVAVPSGNKYDPYWSMDVNTTNLVFNATGVIYIGNQSEITSWVVSSIANYYLRATLDPDGVFRQYMYPKKTSNQSNQTWSVVDFKPPNICEAQLTKVGSGICGFNSYCIWNGANNQSTCVCPEQYSFIDDERKYKGCKPDFEPQSCDLDEAAVMMQFKLTSMSRVDWPFSDYEQYSPITKDQCQKLCLTDCFCALAVFHVEDNTCWKKKMPLSNGNMGDDVQRTVYIKVRKDNGTQSEIVASNKWKKDKKNWIIGSSLFLGSSVLVNILLISIILFGTYCTITIKEVPSMQSNNIGLPLKAFTLMDKSLWLVVVGLLHTAAHDLCVQHLLTAFRTAVSI
jgi:hypothetical protein